MNYNIQFQVAGFCMILVLNIMFFSKKRWVSLQNRIFSVLLAETLLQLAFDITSVCTIVHRNEIPKLNMFLSKGYLVSVLVFIWLIDMYAISNTLYEGMPGWRKKAKIIYAGVLSLAMLATVAVAISGELLFAGEGFYVYSYGSASDSVYIFSAVSVGFVILLLLLNCRHVPIKRQVSVYLFCVMEGLVAMVQAFNKELLIIGFGSALSVFIMYFTLENPDMDMIAALEKAKREAEEAKREADDANHLKSLFLSNMSHEIRTPMNAIIGMTEVIMRNEHSPEETGYLMNIKNSGDALITIINDILDLSKIESGKMEIIEEEYEPMSMINDLAMIIWNRIGEKDIELIFDIDEKLPLRLYGDSLRIRQIIVNLMNNATKFTDTGQVKLEIKITGQEADRVTLLYAVSDTGQGIKEEDREKLFESFSQVNAKINHSKEGTGLGLSISKQLVTLMGGTIGVESEFGRGSRFYFTVPQKVVSGKPAANIYESERKVVVGGRWKNAYGTEQLSNLVDTYGVSYAGDEALPDMDFFFTDDMSYLKGVNLEQLAGNGVTVCFMQNPMHPAGHRDFITAVNKPLFSLNFCQTINREETAGQIQVEDYINFIAPKAKVLLVDDNEMNQVVAVSLLKPMQMEIDLAGNGKEAVEKVKKKRYNLVLMDHMMPVMDGIEATRAIRSLEGAYYKELPIIALTANAMQDAVRMFKDAGMDDFVAKPIETKEICRKIKQHLPRELVLKRVPTENDRAGSGPEDDIAVPDIEGIDKAEGIKNSGSKELFLRLLGDFYRLIDMKSNKIEKCLADGMIKDYTIEVHALKNTARMIGAMELSERFLQMERYGNEGNVGALRAETPEVLELFRSYKIVLEPFGRNADADKEKISVGDLISKLEMVRGAVDNFDIDTSDDVMEELSKVQVPEDLVRHMEQLTVYYSDLAMNEIIETCTDMLDILKNKIGEVAENG